MANEVYATGREIACKASDGKTPAAFPDVCLSPPSPPAGPVPIPYPNTGFASDTTNGSKTVQLTGQEAMLKDQSTFKKSTGDEAATKSLGMGVVTHQITGEVSFTSWSMDVKIEGQNVCRHLDLTLHNEQSLPDNTPPQPHVSKPGAGQGGSPPKCDHDWECTPIKRPSKSIDDVKKELQVGKKAGDPFEAAAVEHNRKQIADGSDVGANFRCKKCKTTKEVDHVLKDSSGKTVGIVQCKADFSAATGKGVTIKPAQLKEDRKLVKSINECQKDSGVKAELTYKLQKGTAADKAAEFLMKEAPPNIVMVSFP
jgi:hypothetical protein